MAGIGQKQLLKFADLNVCYWISNQPISVAVLHER